jgi:phosphoglycerate dehydrogenase-like enzyme
MSSRIYLYMTGVVSPMPDKPRVFISRRLPPQSLARIEAECDVHLWDENHEPPRSVLLDELALADGVLIMLTETIDTDALNAAPRLRVISNYAVGYDNIDIDAATERGIPVGHTPGGLTESCADHAFMLLMAAARRLPEALRYIKDGNWHTWNPIQLPGQDIHGATLGIVGLGRIGYALAKRAQGFGMRLLYHGGSNPEYAERTGAEEVDFETLLNDSDFVSVHVPLTEDTAGLFGAAAFRQMKETAVLINTARGAVVETDALLQALREGHIGAAALDVTDPEPLPADHPLLALDNCLVTPHIASSTLATRERIGQIAADNLLLGLRGESLLHCVNPSVQQP